MDKKKQELSAAVDKSVITIIGERHDRMIYRKKAYKEIKRRHEKVQPVDVIGYEIFESKYQDIFDIFLKEKNMKNFGEALEAEIEKRIIEQDWGTEFAYNARLMDMIWTEQIPRVKVFFDKVREFPEKYKHLKENMEMFLRGKEAEDQHREESQEHKNYLVKLLDYAYKKGIHILGVDEAKIEELGKLLGYDYLQLQVDLDYLVGGLDLLIQRQDADDKEKIDVRLEKEKKSCIEQTEKIVFEKMEFEKKCLEETEENIVKNVHKYCSTKPSNVALIVGEIHVDPLKKKFQKLGYAVEGVYLWKKFRKKDFDKLPDVDVYLSKMTKGRNMDMDLETCVRMSEKAIAEFNKIMDER